VPDVARGLCLALFRTVGLVLACVGWSAWPRRRVLRGEHAGALR